MKKMYKRKISVTGETGTYYVTLPKEIARELLWRKGHKVVVYRVGKKVVVEDKRPGKKAKA